MESSKEHHESANGSVSETTQEENVVMPKAFRSASRSRQWSVLFLVSAFLAYPARKVVVDSSSNDLKFFKGRAEFFYMNSLPGIVKRLLVNLPFVADDAKAVLRLDLNGHTSSVFPYVAADHDRVYRKVVHNFITSEECAIIRGMIQNNALSSEEAYRDDKAEDSLYNEFQSLPVLTLLGVYTSDDVRVSKNEQRVLSDVFKRLQTQVEQAFDSPYITYEHADVTRRRNPHIRHDEKYGNSFFSRMMQLAKNPWERLRYLTTGGHGMHADQCGVANALSDWRDGFQCRLSAQHCCAHRTHTGLLYLNEPNDDLKGGELYIIDRYDIPDDSVASFSGAPFKDIFKRSLTVEPRCGNLVLFRSDARNFHGTYPIREGTRYAVPMWFSDVSQLPWDQGASLLKPYLTNFFHAIEQLECPAMGKGILQAPSGFQDYVDDCKGMVERMIKVAAGDVGPPR
jgi:hypothetical protein